MNVKCNEKSKKEFIKYLIIIIAIIVLLIDCVYLGKTNNIINFEKIAIIAGIIALIGLLLFVIERKNKESLFKLEQDRLIYNTIINLSDVDKKLDLLKELINME